MKVSDLSNFLDNFPPDFDVVVSIVKSAKDLCVDFEVFDVTCSLISKRVFIIPCHNVSIPDKP